MEKPLARMTKTERENFLAQPHVAILALNEDGRGPLAVPIWYHYEPGGEVVFLTDRTSRKGALLELNRRLSLCVQLYESPYQYVSVEGPIVALDTAGAEAHLRPLAVRYLGEAEGNAYADEMVPELADGSYCLVRVRPARWLTANYARD
jgi:nitroimidazol reductase NimA-like FMN-containing flavoprotein (pyridoxamine 5'-phosphate oxidase superfamily)